MRKKKSVYLPVNFFEKNVTANKHKLRLKIALFQEKEW
jgi:hypothetical protein